MRGIIYKATNTFNGKVYIGQTVAGLPKRRKQHYKDAKNDESNLFHFALYQYPNGFTWDVVDTFEGDQESVIHALNVAEEYHILKYNSTDQRFGYNSTGGGYSSGRFAEHIRKRAQAIGGDEKPVLQYDENGHFVQEFPSINAVAAHLGKEKVHLKVITIGLHYGYQWRLKRNEYYPKNIDPYKKALRSSVRVAVYDGEGNLHGVYNSATEAARETGINAYIRGNVSDISIQEWKARPFYFFNCENENLPEKISITINRKTSKVTAPKDCRKRVAAYSLDGDFVAEYDSIKSASEQTGASTSWIRNYCRKELPIVIPPNCRARYLWRYVSGVSEKKIDIVDLRSEKVEKMVWKFMPDGSKRQVPITMTKKRVEYKSHEKKMEHRIIQYSLDGEFIKVWDNTHQAAESGADTENLIRKCLTGKRKSPKLNYQWAFYTPDYRQDIGKMEKDTPKKVGRKPKNNPAVQVARPDERIEEVDKSGRVIAVYKDTADAAEKSGYSQSYICNVIAGRIHYPKRKFRRAK